MSAGHHIRTATSSDLVHWKLGPDALPSLPSWTNGKDTWAPDVSLHNDTTLRMYFAATRGSDGVMCIGIATSPATSPTGPFTASETPVVCSNTSAGHSRFSAIDPKLWVAPNGVSYLFFGSGGDPIRAVVVDADGGTRAVGPTFDVLHTDATPYSSLVEAPWVYTAPSGELLMLYSGNNCCGEHAHYAVLAASSPSNSPLGPWEKLGGGDKSSVILSSSAAATAPGHNAVIRDEAGVDWAFYHANNGPKPCAAQYCSRTLFVDRVWYNATGANGRGGWPWVGGPSGGPRQAPTV